MKIILKRTSALLAAALITLSTSFIPTFATELNDADNFLDIETVIEIVTEEENNNPEFSHNHPEGNPSNEPDNSLVLPFDAKVMYTNEGFTLVGTIPENEEIVDLFKESTSIVPYYSIDGEEYFPNFIMDWRPTYTGKLSYNCFLPSQSYCSCARSGVKPNNSNILF